MTIIVTFKVAQGVVLAADSRMTILENGRVVHLSDTHTKIFPLGPWAGVMTCGSGFLGGIYVQRLIAQFTRKLDVTLPLKALVEQLLAQLPPADSESTSLIISGFDPDAPDGFAAQIYKITIFADGQKSFFDLSGSVSFWDGEFEAVTRLLLGRSPIYTGALCQDPVGAALVQEADDQGVAKMRIPYYALTLIEGVNLAQFLVNLQIQYQYFASDAQSCGGSVDVAVITPDKGFQWVSHKTLP